MIDQEDISDSWDDLKPAKVVEPMAQVDFTAPGISELTDDFLDAQGAPKEFYNVVRGYGLNDMGIQKYRCVGLSVKTGQGTGSRRSPAYVGLPEEVIWAGPKFRVNLDKKYKYSKGQVALTVEDAYKMLDKYRAEHISERRLDIKRMEQQIAGCQKSIQDMEASIQALENIPYPLSESGPTA
jgi:hypothetical protein